MLKNALASESVPKPIPARWAPITVPTPRAPQGTAHWPQLASTAALSGVNPAASKIGALMTTATPNPVTDSKKGRHPDHDPGRERHAVRLQPPEKPRHSLDSPSCRKQVVEQ